MSGAGRPDAGGRPRVVVVGGGLAGLSAAIACLDGGAAVTLLESRPRLGGATWSFTRHGLSFDNGQHVYLRCCTAYQRFLERVGTAHLAPLQDRLSIPVLRPTGGGVPEVVWLRRDRLPAPLHLARSLAGYRHLGLGDRARLGRAALALRRLSTSDANLDEESFADFLGRHGQSQAAISALWELISLPTTNVRAEQCSLQLAAKVFRTGLLSEADAADIGWARAPLSRLHAEPAEQLLTRGGALVRRRARVEAVVAERRAVPGRAVPDDGSATAPHPSVRGVSCDGVLIEAEAVVLAVPHTAVEPLLPPGALPGAAPPGGLGTSPIIDVNIVFDRQVMPYTLAAGIDTPVQYVFDRSDAAGLDPADGQCLAVSVSGADAEHGDRPEVLVERYTAALRQLFPMARGARVIDAVVTREHEATFRGTPGSAALRRPSTTAYVNLFLAGAWTDTGWPATMEGAVRSGNTAAAGALAVLARRGRRSPVPAGRSGARPGQPPVGAVARGGNV